MEKTKIVAKTLIKA